MVLYIGFQFGTFYSQEYLPGYHNTDPKVEVGCLVAYHYSPVGGPMVKLRHITLQATVRFQGYPQANLPLHPGNCIYSFGSQRVSVAGLILLRAIQNDGQAE